MDNNLCPLLKEKCKEKTCVMWRGESCLIINFMEVIIRPAQREPVENNTAGRWPKEDWITAIENATPEELAEELIKFAKKEFSGDQESLEHGAWYENIRELFLESKNVKELDVPATIRSKMMRADRLAEELWERDRKSIIEKKITYATPENIAKELAEFFKKETINPDKDLCYIHSTIKDLFWAKRGIDNHCDVPPEISLLIEKIENLAEKQLNDEIEAKHKLRLEKENECVPPLVTACVSWAKERGLRSVTRTDVRAFMMEKKYEEVLPETEKSIYAMVNVQLKTKTYVGGN